LTATDQPTTTDAGNDITGSDTSTTTDTDSNTEEFLHWNCSRLRVASHLTPPIDIEPSKSKKLMRNRKWSV
jgi:hypothetical protein